MLSGLPMQFYGIVGHKEGLARAPEGSVVLARSDRCIQMLRVGRNVYATQFHPELDADGLEFRLNIYKHAGYCRPEEVQQLVTAARRQVITQPVKILRSFVGRYGAPTAQVTEEPATKREASTTEAAASNHAEQGAAE